jgi:excisionase family DNA binding protein
MEQNKTKPFFQIPETGPVRPAEAAAYLRVSRCTIYEWAKLGKLTIHKGGARTSYLRAEELRRLAGETIKPERTTAYAEVS